MQSAKKFVVSFILIASLDRVALGQATIAQHLGSNDPTTEGFTVFSFGKNAQGSGVSDDSGVTAWETSGQGSISYFQSLPDLSGLNWTFSVIIKVLPVYAGSDFRAAIEVGSSQFVLNFSAASNGDIIVQESGAQINGSYTLNGTANAYNSFQIAYNSSENAATLSANGTVLLAGISEGQPTGPGTLGFSASDQSSISAMQANWNLVSVTIPEPSVAKMLLLGALGLLGLRFWDGKSAKTVIDRIAQHEKGVRYMNLALAEVGQRMTEQVRQDQGESDEVPRTAVKCR